MRNEPLTPHQSHELQYGLKLFFFFPFFKAALGFLRVKWMVYIWYGTNRGLSQFLPEETAPLFSFEVAYRYLAIQTSLLFFKDIIS